MSLKGLCTAAGILAAIVASAGDLIVSEPMTISETNDYRNAEIHANLTVAGALRPSVAVTGEVFSVGSESGDSPVITIGAYSSLLTQHLMPGGSGGSAGHWLWPACVIGENGGTAKFVVSDSWHLSHDSSQRPTTGLGLWLGGVTISENAAVNNAADDTIDILQLDRNGYADIAALSNLNAKTVRILFNGGKLRMHYAGSRGSIANYCPAGKSIEYHSVDGNDIYLYKVYYAPFLIGGGGTLKTSGDGDVVIYEEGFTESSNKVKLQLRNDIGTIEWGHGGDLRLEWGGILMPKANDCMPYGAGTGIVRLNGANDFIYPEIDLNGTSQKMNGLVTTGEAFVSNRVSTAASVVLGEGDYAGAILNARIFGNVTVVKNGSGALAVTNTVAPALNIVSGTVTIGGADCTIGAVTVASGAALVVDGATLTCQSLSAVAEDISCINGGKIIRQLGAATGETHNWDTLNLSDGCIEKIGANTVTLHPLTAVEDRILVNAGTLTLSGRGYCTNEWWRIWLKSPHGTGAGASMELGEWCIWQSAMPEGTKLGYYNYRTTGTKENVVFNAQGKAASELANGEVTIGDGWKWKVGGNEGDPATLFDAGAAHYLLCITNHPTGWKDIDPADWTQWVPITVRMKKGQIAGSYSLSGSEYHCYSCVKSWLLESSPDGITWQTMDERVVVEVPTQAGLSSTGGFFNNRVEYRFQNVTMPNSAGLSSAAVVSVASGATLDLDYTPDANAVIGRFEYDLASGGGTITKFIPAESGNLNLVGTKPAYGDLTLSYTFGTVKNAANLANWTVSLNGEEKDNYHAEIVDGKLVVHVVRKGLMLQVK